MKVLITGATGLVGSEIVKLCHKEKIAVNYLTTSKDKIENQSNYQGFYWNPNKGEIDESCLEGVTKIINLVGASVSKPWTSSHKKAIIESRVNSANLLLKTLKENENQITQIVSASAIGVYPDSLTNLYHEDYTGKAADNFLGEVVNLWETAVDQFEQEGLEVCKVRIGLVLSDKGGALEPLQKVINNYIGSPLGSGKQWQSWIHIEDLARIFIFAIQKNIDGIINGVAPNPVTNKRLTYIIAKKLHKPIIMPKVPKLVLNTVLGERSALVLSSQLVSNSKLDALGFIYYYSYVGPALEDLL
ncbi:TIGR01777 family oxidoreductase [Mesonia aestuariivivens]|uniref:TIGR01777 family oxidoreductase n=1 Tax=Mesonia aestuariivivens TaxID=2796128 RepID=A0ABS6W428_9FLAO|nr:TIGR01777 family oxidoreductase [Mesonia aestuariivivens]MBW2962574.1 TIGR01777 family oxidoreductase [Mesonia aestuariivivens]